MRGTYLSASYNDLPPFYNDLPPSYNDLPPVTSRPASCPSHQHLTRFGIVPKREITRATVRTYGRHLSSTQERKQLNEGYRNQCNIVLADLIRQRTDTVFDECAVGLFVPAGTEHNRCGAMREPQ